MRIGLAGPIGSGKTTIARALQERLAGCIIIPMAKPLKDFAKHMGWDGRKDTRGRRLLQLLGTECGRKCISEQLWVDKWQEEAKGHPYVISDDVRFENEAEIMDMIIKLPMRYDDCDSPFQIFKKWLRYKLGWVHKSELGVPYRPGMLVVPKGMTINQTVDYILERL